MAIAKTVQSNVLRSKIRYESESQLRRYLPAKGILYGAIAGIAGGLAEIAWVSFYAAFTGGDAGAVARGVTAAVIGGTTDIPVTIGTIIHMSLALVLGIALAFALRPYWLRRGLGGYGATVMALAGVWAVNFLIVLPYLSPGFLALLPYQATFASKILFGLAAAWTFRRLVAAEQLSSAAEGAKTAG
jgi:hypothetical protein